MHPVADADAITNAVANVFFFSDAKRFPSRDSQSNADRQPFAPQNTKSNVKHECHTESDANNFTHDDSFCHSEPQQHGNAERHPNYDYEPDTELKSYS